MADANNARLEPRKKMLIEGHGGPLDRLDSVSFAAPMFFHMTRYIFEP